MKKVFFFGSTLCVFMFFAACNEQPKADTHQHEDGSVHTDHAPDTANLQQQEFKVGDSINSDTTANKINAPANSGEHSHGDGEKHSH